MLTLCGVAIVVAGFVAGFNPLLVVTVAAVATGLAAGLDAVAVISALGRAFTQNRYVGIVWLVLPVIGMLERAGLRERAQALIARSRQATTGRVLALYFVVRQLAAALGLTALGGHAQMVRPLVAPMAEAAAERRFGAITPATRFLIRAHAAAADNIGGVLRRGHLHRHRLHPADQGFPANQRNRRVAAAPQRLGDADRAAGAGGPRFPAGPARPPVAAPG